jgi:hypothetical protein
VFRRLSPPAARRLRRQIEELRRGGAELVEDLARFDHEGAINEVHKRLVDSISGGRALRPTTDVVALFLGATISKDLPEICRARRVAFHVRRNIEDSHPIAVRGFALEAIPRRHIFISELGNHDTLLSGRLHSRAYLLLSPRDRWGCYRNRCEHLSDQIKNTLFNSGGTRSSVARDVSNRSN